MQSDYYALYKCTMCNDKFRINNEYVQLDETTAQQMAMQVIQNQQLMGSILYSAPMWTVHRCKNGDAGIAQFIGFKKVAQSTKRKSLLQRDK